MNYKPNASNTGKALLKWVWTELPCLRNSAHSRAVINRFWPQVIAAISLRVNSALIANAANFKYDQSLVFIFFPSYFYSFKAELWPVHQRKLEPRWMSTFVACEAALQLSKELLCWLCSARAVKGIQENSQDDSCTLCGRAGCKDLTEGVKRGAAMSFPAALWCGRSITSSFIYPWQGYLACHCRFFILGEHVCVRYRKFILLSTEEGEWGVQQADALQPTTRSNNWGMWVWAGSFPCPQEQGLLIKVIAQDRGIWALSGKASAWFMWSEEQCHSRAWFDTRTMQKMDRFWGLAVTQVIDVGKEGTSEITDLCRCQPEIKRVWFLMVFNRLC